MKRTALGLTVLLCSFALVACNGTNNNNGNDGGNNVTDGGNNGGSDGGTTDGGSTDGGTNPTAGTVTVNSSQNALPSAWSVSDATVLKSDGSGTGAKAAVDELVTLNVATTVDSSATCALPYTSSSGKTYCDSFNVKDSSGNEVVVDDYSFLGAHPTCTMPPAGGTSLATVTGVWEDNYNSTSKTDTWAIALPDCSGFGGTGYTGTNQPAMTTDIATLNQNLQNGPVTGIHGVVIAEWAASSAWGFTMEDPGGGAAIRVYKGSSSTSTAAEPSVGDDVTVSGTVSALAHEIKL